MTESEFITITVLTDNQAAVLLSGMTWNKMLEFRSEYTRALDRYSRKHKGNINGIDTMQVEALGAVARFDRLLRTRYYNSEKIAPRFYGVPKEQAKKKILAEFYNMTRNKF